MTFTFFLSLLILLVALGFVMFPLFSSKTAKPFGNTVSPLADLKLRKEEILESLKDLELDRQMKKMTEEDYQVFFQETVQEGADILKKIEETK